MKIVLPFQEDTSLIFASKVAPLLRARGHEVAFLWAIDRNGPDAVSDRQIQQNIGAAPFEKMPVADAMRSPALMEADAVIVSRMPPVMRTTLAGKAFKKDLHRPCFIAFHAGLDFTPSRGFVNRKDFDVYFTNLQPHVKKFKKAHRSGFWQHVSFGTPYARMPTERRTSSSGNVYFFAQAISPKSLKSRMHIVRVLAAIARANPERDVFIKLRHLPTENTNHVHRERHDYATLLETLGDRRPRNLHVSDCKMDVALSDAAFCITCTSTAAIDAISAGIRTAIYLDYVDFRSDALREPMRAEFEESGIITPLADLLELRVGYPDASWMETRFRGNDLFDELECAVAAFKTRTPVRFDREKGCLS